VAGDIADRGCGLRIVTGGLIEIRMAIRSHQSALGDVAVLEEQRMADRQYELVYILPPETTEQQVAELHSQVDAVVSRMSGHIEKTENWGRKRLAYDIGRNKEGVYVLQVINGGGELMKELDRRLKVMDQVIRHMVVRVDQEKKVVERTQTKRRTESERRRVKRGLPPQRQPGEGRQSAELDDVDDDRYDGVEV
jgi:small subunit ribosomal protein S6